jgi:nitrogen fixation protein NifX
MTEIGHLKIAITTNDLTQVDADFISAKQMVFYDVTYDSSEFLDCVQFGMVKRGVDGKGPGGGTGCSNADTDETPNLDRIGTMVEALDGCAVLFTRGLSDPQAVRVKNAGVFPVKMERSRSIPEVVAHLQGMLNKNPPLWLRRAMRDSAPDAEYLLEATA